MSRSERVRIHYRRLPDHEEIFDQRIVLERDDVVVSVTEPLDRLEPLRAGDTVLLEPGARAVWLTFPGAWHDIGTSERLAWLNQRYNSGRISASGSARNG